MERLDVTLVRRGLCPSRERAQESIRAGCVLLNGKAASRPSTPVAETDSVEVTRDPIGFVGRGGLKLEAALDRFRLNPSGLACLDVGASTGGFTDCLLRRGARMVFAVDVGRDQLHPDLRSDVRVSSMEQTDIRNVERLPEPAGLAVVDVSFIPLGLVLPSVHRLITLGAPVVALIKPQFEVGVGKLGKGGIVKDPAAREAAREAALSRASESGFAVEDCFESPVVGTEGNQEYLTLLRCNRL